jgi:large repetitive protein
MVPALLFSISASLVRIFRALILSEAVLALIFLHSAPAIGKWYYVGDRNVAETFLGGDGSAAAPSGTPQYADLLYGYAVRPSWQVAGVDYAVGAHPDVVLKVPTAGNLPPGTELRVGAIYVTGNNVTLSGYDLTGLTVMITDSARGTVTITDCVATSNVNIRSTVTATANLVVTYCTLDGGGMSSDPNFQLIKVWTPLTVEYCLIQNAPAAIYAGAPLTVMYNAMSGFAWAAGAHANAIYVIGGSNLTIAYNTIWSGNTRNAQGLPIGIGAAIALFGDGGSYDNTNISNNVVISDLPNGASYLIGYYISPPNSATRGVVSNNYVASINGFNNANSGAFGAFYTGSTGVVQATYTNNINMNTGRAISGSNTESVAPLRRQTRRSSQPSPMTPASRRRYHQRRHADPFRHRGRQQYRQGV